ncbi:MAG TPA: NUDIX domain-containing protein [Methylomirabilota bacterium]
MREYPAAPLVGVRAVVVDGDRVLLVQRGRPPALGRWSLPGGLVGVGEPVEAALPDYLATPAAPGRVEAGSDALAAQWCDQDALGRLDATEGVESMVRRAFALEAERRREERG